MKSDLTRTSDAELIRFCVAAARQLKAVDRGISGGAGLTLTPTAISGLRARLDAAIEELNARQ